MRFGNREGRAPVPKARRRGPQFRPQADRLEERQLLTAIDLVNTVGGGPGPYGVQMIGNQSPEGAGFSSANVGDVNGDGLDDFLIGAPTLNAGLPTFPALGNGQLSRTYLVFGSNAVPNTPLDWLVLTPNDRLGDLAQIGDPTQNNLVTGEPQFPFDGLEIIVGGAQNSLLGASVAGAGDINGDGFADFLIGAPGAPDPANPLSAGAGRAFLIYGGPQLATLGGVNQVLDLSNPGVSGVNVITFVSPILGSFVGRGVAGLGDFLPDGRPDIAIGAPGATVNGLAQSGAVFVIPGTYLTPARSQVINIFDVGQPATGIPGVVFSGATAGAGAGFSVAGAGNVNGAVSGQQATSDLLIGAPDSVTGLPGTSNGPGRAFLVYGSDVIAGASLPINNYLSISLGRVINPLGPTAIPGAAILGATAGDLTGYSVSTAGDFNNDGLADFLVGSPGANALAGRADLIYGRSSATPAPGLLLGPISLGDLAGVRAATFAGVSPGQLAGYAVGASGPLNAPLGLTPDPLGEALIGSPGFNNSSGAVFVIPGNINLTGIIPLDSAAVQGAPAFALVITNSLPVGPSFVGASVGGRPFQGGGALTADRDRFGDFAVGAPGYSFSAARTFAGAAFLLEGAFLPVEVPPVTADITSPISINDAPPPPYFIPAGSTAPVEFFILSGGSNTPGFTPPVDIDPTTITVNGVLLPDPSTFGPVGDIDGDGIEDAGFLFPPELLGLPAQGTVQFVVQAQTLEGSQFPNQTYLGTASATIRTAIIVDPSIPLPAFGGAFPSLSAAAPRFGERFVPQPHVLGRPQWKPLPPRLAIRQFLPQGPFGLRLRNYFHPGTAEGFRRGDGTLTLEEEVFTRGRFRNGAYFGRINHGGPVVGGPLVGPYGRRI